MFGIMRGRYRKSAALGIPFFSKISLRAVTDRIELMGYRVEVHPIEKLKNRPRKPIRKAAQSLIANREHIP